MDQKPGTIFGNNPWSKDEMTKIENALHQGLDMEDVAKRRGPGGTTLTYIEGWKAFEMANSIFGVDGWSCQIKSLSLDYAPEYSKSKDRWTVSATALVTIKLKNGSYHEDVGCGNGTSKNKFDAIESAKKQAVTDARKRALRLLGPKLGNCLYDKKFKITKRKAISAERSVNTTSSNHVATFRPCKTAPPASYQSKNTASVKPASVSFERRNCPKTLASNKQGALPVDKAAHTVQPLHKKQKTSSVTMEAKSKMNANECKTKPIPKNSTTDIVKNSKEHEAIDGYDDDLFKSVDLDQLQKSAKKHPKYMSKKKPIVVNHDSSYDPFGYGISDIANIPDPKSVDENSDNLTNRSESIAGKSVAY